MIIPVKCFTCGKVLANKYRYYIQEVEKRKLDKSIDVDEIQYLSNRNAWIKTRIVTCSSF